MERLQGQKRALMFASFGVGDSDQIHAEEEFIYPLNRFNVTASRARARFITLLSRRLADHLPRERRVLEGSPLLRHFVDGFLRRSEPSRVPGFGATDLRSR